MQVDTVQIWKNGNPAIVNQVDLAGWLEKGWSESPSIQEPPDVQAEEQQKPKPGRKPKA